MTRSEVRELQKKRQKCEVYSRSIGYIRPVQQWNNGKKEEFKDRKLYKVAQPKLAVC
jgi:anaerobic ribonucleoside-triphosphate reductase